MGNKESKRQIILLTILLIAILVYFFQTQKDHWKILLISAELFLTISLSYFFLKKDILHIENIHEHIMHIYQPLFGSEHSTGRNAQLRFITKFLGITGFIFLVFSIIVSCYCIYSACFYVIDGSRISLLIKTTISTVIGLGCVIVIGKSAVEYAADKSEDMVTLIAARVGQDDVFRRYEFSQ